MTVKARVIATTLIASLGATVLLAGCSGGGIQPATDLPEPDLAGVETTETSIYYATGRTLLQERRVVDLANVYEETLYELLLASPEENPDVAIVQPVAEVLSVTVEDGVATVDWSAEVLDFEAEPSEKRIALASILTTLGQFPEIEKVQFTVEGKAEGEIGGKDVTAFWGDVSLLNQPWDTIIIKGPSEESSQTAEPTATP